VAKALYDPLESVAAIATNKDERSAESEGEQGGKQAEAKKQARIVLATLKPKGGAKVCFSLFSSPSFHFSFLLFFFFLLLFFSIFSS
jgi:hypothetical protein